MIHLLITEAGMSLFIDVLNKSRMLRITIGANSFRNFKLDRSHNNYVTPKESGFICRVHYLSLLSAFRKEVVKP